MKKILLGLTTTPKSDWREKVKEINKFKIKEIALFPTMLAMAERKELYKLLEKTCVKRIPHVHLRDDMENWELDYFSGKYKTKLFNIHLSQAFDKLVKQNKKYLKKIYIENNLKIDDGYAKLLKDVGGICFDVSHFHDLWAMRKIPAYNDFPRLLEEYPIGCCHLSAIREQSTPCNSWDLKSSELDEFFCYHWLDNLSQLDYVKNYIDFLPEYVSIELENSFEEQIEARKYLEKIINC